MCVKIPYYSLESAQKALRGAQADHLIKLASWKGRKRYKPIKVEQRVYECDECGCFHLTSRPERMMA